MEITFNAFCHLLDRPRLSEARCALDQQVPVGQQGDQQFMNEVLLANNLLPEPMFEVREKLIVHKSGLYVDRFRNGAISDHFKA